MMLLDKSTIGRQAKELGFVRDTLEKVYRLVDVLDFFSADELLGNALALKGGTAINLTVFDLPRLSVDIDLDYCKSIDMEGMAADREIITSRILKYMTAGGYTLSQKSKKYHALDSFVYDYINCGGVKDNLKIEINYMLRCHVFPLDKREIKLPLEDEKIRVLSVNQIEIFASKTVALLTRTAPRDLYDIHNMIRYGIIEDNMKELFRKCVVFYSAISMEKSPELFDFDNIGNVTSMQIRRELDPVLRHGEHISLELIRDEVISFMKGILDANEDECLFWKRFSEGVYLPELVFQDETKNIENHPMALWKCRNRIT